MRYLRAVLILGLSTTANAQSPSRFDFSIANIMRGPEVYGREPQQVRWTPDGRWLYFMWNEPGTAWQERLRPYRVRPEAGARPQRVTDAHMDSVGPLIQPGRLSTDKRFRVVSFQGDVYVVDLAGGSARRLTDTPGAETEPSFSGDGRGVFFVRDDNVFSVDLASGLTRQLTDVRSGPAPRDSAKAEGQRGALQTQQRELFEAVRDRAHADSIAAAERKEREGRRAKALYLLPNERVTSLSVAPSERSLRIMLTRRAGHILRSRSGSCAC
jgi:dipeptidyl aminopeptidase/acylaminoacyl peptidase